MPEALLDPRPVRRALLSVSDKTGIAEFAKRLAEEGVELVSTGGTARLLREKGLEVRDVSELTGFPEIMDGRVKTLHPGVHGGLLADRRRTEHLAALSEHGIAEIDLLVVNLYPFEETLRSGADAETIVENIDIGGPAMIRAAAKNHASVAVVTDPEDYDAVLDAVKAGGTDLALRRRLAGIAYARTAQYDSLIATWFAKGEDEAPRRVGLSGRLAQTLRYGENPHQWAAAYKDGSERPGVLSAEQVQGKALSYNNLNDTDAAYELVAELPRDRAGVAIIKHANPCGVASGETLGAAYEAALRCDPVSAFGGIVALNRPLDGPTAEMIAAIFTEVVIAPDADEAARAAFAKKKNLRLLLTESLPDPAAEGALIKPIAGGFLFQSRDSRHVGPDDLRVVTERAPTEDELRDLLFAFTVAKHVKSNAIVYAKDGATVGIGAGQMSRIDSTRIAAIKSEDAAVASKLDQPLVKGSVVASDAFFPFADGLLAAASAGATAVIQPGGSIRDEEVIKAADEQGLAMVFTGVRHFRH
ncbi:bifunctional phosphoribosylaminoimidazolecarboxamide formyltransferase/IMP cyclohydrolase [Parvularcula oceani]|uniref:bifunctional phosphoribosylaminoimidazolecarboxamide formyltransferase/IMP cyclohydrolase n=1 Tax=Parvularcula oceani TaxID=1247963 RepID=UPI0004E151E0|nr:bifunctional phosphoribosylaminoimidazolecarboxamide formyltransferase/IMP cyclohydrolase [Parvularcula oceani]